MDARPINPAQPVGSVEQISPQQISALGSRKTPAAPDAATAIAAVIDTAILLQLSPSDTGKLISILDPPTLPQHASQLADLLRGAVSAAQAGDVDRALEQLAELITLDPTRAQTLRTEPGLEPIQAQVNHLLSHLETVAGLGAQDRLETAAHTLESLKLESQRFESVGAKPLAGWDTPPQTLLTMANRLYDAGGYVNYIHAAVLAQVLIDGAGSVPARVVRTRREARPGKPGPRLTSASRLKALWIRAPLLILLVSWFGLGLAGGSVAALLHYFRPAQWPNWFVDAGFEMWGMGLLALVAFGFYVRVRRIRLR